MTIIKSLSSSLGQKGNDANIALAKEIAETENHDAIKKRKSECDKTSQVKRLEKVLKSINKI